MGHRHNCDPDLAGVSIRIAAVPRLRVHVRATNRDGAAAAAVVSYELAAWMEW